MNIDSAISMFESGQNINDVAEYLKLLKKVVTAKTPSSPVSFNNGPSTAGPSSKNRVSCNDHDRLGRARR